MPASLGRKVFSNESMSVALDCGGRLSDSAMKLNQRILTSVVVRKSKFSIEESA